LASSVFTLSDLNYKSSKSTTSTTTGAMRAAENNTDAVSGTSFLNYHTINSISGKMNSRSTSNGSFVLSHRL